MRYHKIYLAKNKIEIISEKLEILPLGERKQTMSSQNNYDVIIVGAGSMGMAAGYYLARQGVKTLLVDAYDPPHTNGSHHGDTRIIRHAYGEGRQYVPLVLRAQQLWGELQEETSEKIFEKTGVLAFGPKGSSFTNEMIASAEKYDLPLEVLQANEVMERWPGIVIPEELIGCFEPDSGVLFCENCIRTYRELAAARGATLLMNTPIVNIEIHEHSATVFTAKDSFTADKLIVSAGAWNKKILQKTGMDLPLQPSRRTIGWFEADETLYNSAAFPAFTAETLEGEMYYGFPSFERSGVKIGRHDFGQDIDPDKINREFGIYPEDESFIRGFLRTYMPKAEGKLNKGRVCMYTNTPDEDFVIDQVPGYEHVAIAAGFSGHGFKFASVVGEILSQFAVNGRTEHDISIFSLSRPALQKN